MPWKLLAVRSGLAQYGKNNITFIQGLGSFYRLVAFISDLPCAEDNWGEFKSLDDCRNCDACTKACPSGAIGPDALTMADGSKVAASVMQKPTVVSRTTVHSIRE